MFVTFYAYKGGVGRSLALANVACLLAEDDDHPQRVLLWDFDLEAPGLHKLFPSRQPHRGGFVDLAYEYAETGEVPDVERYIYASGVDGVDVLPAGIVDATYCEKLQHLNWPGFFTKDPTDPGKFFGPLLESIRARQHDYVLIDSRTGLNDQAGICTQVLPDLIVTLFRLTEQNLDGLEHVVPAIREELNVRGKGGVKVLPLASSVPSTSSKGIHESRDRAAKIFDVKALNYIRFDPDLVAEEKLFCLEEVRSQLWPVPPIVNDYRELTKIIRTQNPEDTRTAIRRLHEEIIEEDSATVEAILFPLLKRRPRLPQLWETLTELVARRNIKPERAGRLVDSILEKDKENAFAWHWKARQLAQEADSPKSESFKKAEEYLQMAIHYSSEPANMYRELADVLSCRGDLDGATRALKESRRLAPRNAGTALHLAYTHIRRGADYFALAVDVLEEIAEDTIREKYALLAYLHGFLGNTKKAEDAFSVYEKLADDWQRTQLCLAYLRLTQRGCDDARHIAEHALGASDKKASPTDRLNWGEFFICAGSFDRAVELLEDVAPEREKTQDEAGALLRLAEYLGETKSQQSARDVLDAWEEQRGWDFRELLVFRERMRVDRSEKLTRRLDVLEDLITQQQFRNLRDQTLAWIHFRPGAMRVSISRRRSRLLKG